MTLIEVIDAARGLAGEPLSSTRSFPDNTSSFWQDSVLISYVNLIQSDMAQEIIQANEDFFTTNSDLNITANCATYTLPSRFVLVRRVEDIRTGTPTEIPPVTLNNRSHLGYVRNTSQAFDQGYYLLGNNIVFDSTPTFSNTAAYRMWYARTPADLNTASDVSEIPVEHHRIMVWGLLAMMQEEQQGDSSKADARYERGLQKMVKQVENRQTQRARTVKRSGRY